jgi:hypothetical protein
MANPYVYGGISITRKTGNRFALPAGEDPLKWIDYLDVNAIIDLLEKTATAAPFHAFAATATKPTELGASQRGLWVDSDDNKLYYWNGTSSVEVPGAGGGGGYATIQNNGSSVTQRTTLNIPTGSGIVAVDDGTSKTLLGWTGDIRAAGGDLVVWNLLEGIAAAYTVEKFKRNGTVLGSHGFSAADKFVITGTNGIVLTGAIEASGAVFSGSVQVSGLTVTNDIDASAGNLDITDIDASGNVAAASFTGGTAALSNATAGTAALVVDKAQASAGVYTLAQLNRDGAAKATLGLDGNDELQITGSAWGVKVTGGVHVLELSNSSGTVLRANGVVGFNMDANRAYRDGRWSDKKGANVAIGATLTLGVAGNGGNLYEVTGNGTAVDRITSTDWQDGAVVTLWFSNTTSNTVNHGTAASGADLGIKLAGSANFTSGTSGFSTLTLRKTAAWFIEISRSIG